MNYQLVTSKTADAHIADAYEWYESRKDGLGDEFLASFDECCRRICNLPFAYSVKRKDFRQATLRRFPYVVIYEVRNSDIMIYSVFHSSRHPSKKFRKS